MAISGFCITLVLVVAMPIIEIYWSKEEKFSTTVSVISNDSLVKTMNSTSSNSTGIEQTAINAFFRKYYDLQSLQNLHFTSHKILHYPNRFFDCNKLCYLDNKFYLLERLTDKIFVHSQQGDFIESLQMIKSNLPKALHPISTQHLLLATRSGLQLINSSGYMIETLRHGEYCQVHADDKYIVSTVCSSRKLTVLYNEAPYKTHIEFSHSGSTQSVLVADEWVFVTDSGSNAVTQYTTSGQKVWSHAA